MAITSSAVTVTTSATLLATGPCACLIRVPAGGADVYIGGSGVTTANSVFLAPTDGLLPFDLADGEPLYGIVASSTQAVRVLTSKQTF